MTTTGHPLDHFRYCPHCGAADFSIINVKAKRCDKCTFIYYANAAAATACFIRNDKGELLVARRACEPAKGSFDLPGGFVDMDESAEEAIARELMEEAGLSVSSLRYLFSLPNIYRYSDMEIHTLDLFYETTVPSSWQPLAQDDVAELHFLPLNQVDPALFGLTSIRKAIERYLTLNAS